MLISYFGPFSPFWPVSCSFCSPMLS
ncbi:hypothetical protein F383_34493 [Gossypium arboreum]|uniref:Uncharacterized protein n=1 Tax=Gossypium arboreum TaxID=29729 RepID=A0A0B0N2K9_GOSAR|nr:hypothetical protein F383_34493 [Gossypium arboreum]